MKFKKIMALAVATLMSISLVACGNNSSNGDSTTSTKATAVNDTLVIGVSEMNGVFNPFFYSTAYDRYAFEPVFDTICVANDDNELEPLAGDITYEEFTGEDGKDYVKYTVSIQEGIKFHDGIEATIDDVIFAYYVYADPAYDGLVTFRTAPIVGLEEYITGGDEVDTITGIEKIDDYTCTVLFDEVSIISEELLNVDIIPSHYYGVADDGTVFTKGDMSVPKSRNDAPIGTGPYVFISYENNIVSYEANQDYFLGAPLTQYLKQQVVTLNNRIDSIANGEVDITSPSAEKENIIELEERGIEYSIIDDNGYTFIGINTNKIPDINVRKGIMHLINRGPAIESYYGELAQIIERPLTKVLPEYPEDAEEYYGYDKEKAFEYFTLAGYTKDSSGKLVNSAGEQLKVEFAISDLATSPLAGIISQLKTDLEELGAELIVSDIDFNVIVDRIVSGDIEMYSIGWGNITNADLTQLFHSSSANGSGSNYNNLIDPELDKIIEQISVTLDLEERKVLVAEALDLVMENAVVMPLFQKTSVTIYNTDTLNIDSVYRSNSPFHTYRDEIHLIEMK